MPPQPRIGFANNLRGIAAFCVVVGHYLGVFWNAPQVVAAQMHTPRMVASAGSLAAFARAVNHIPLFQWGPFGVALFFLISGFVIPLSFRDKGPLSFLAGRFFRIYPVYAVGFMVSLVSMVVTRRYFGMAPVQYEWGHLVAHFLPGVRTALNYPSIDGIIWTLEIEVAFYLLCAPLFLVLRKARLTIFAVPAALFAVALAIGRDIPGIFAYTQQLYSIAINVKIFAIFLIFMFIGVAFNYHYRRRIGTRQLLALVAVLFAGFAISWRAGPIRETLLQVPSYLMALTTFLTIFLCRPGWKGGRSLSFFASISYPLYVVHPLLGYGIMLILRDQGVDPWIALLIALTVALGLALGVHLTVERWSLGMGKRIGGWRPAGAVSIANRA